MRIATWNVNSLNARLEKVGWWLSRARPDVLLMQETKLADEDAPHEAFRGFGYELAHHGEGRWNGVAVASRVGIADVETNFGQPLGAGTAVDVPGDGDGATGGGSEGSGDEHPLSEARMIAATCGGVRVISVYVPNGRSVGSPFYAAKLAWLARLRRWLAERCDPASALVLGGDMNIAPEDRDVWDPVACHGGTHVSPEERAAYGEICAWGLEDAWRRLHPEGERYSWWDYRAGMFHKNYGMRIDLLLATRDVAARVVAAEIDREARKGKPTPSDHAPVFVDVDEPGVPVDPGWAGAEGRIAARRR